MENEKLKEKLNEFKKLLESENNETRKQVHYNSTFNIVNELLKFKKIERAEKFKILMIEYIDELNATDLPLGKIRSAELYKKYVLKSGQFLIHERDFRPKGINILKYLVLGIILDVLAYYFFNNSLPFYFPVITILLILFGIFRERKLISERKCFGINY